jgi:hypothetical protein
MLRDRRGVSRAADHTIGREIDTFSLRFSLRLRHMRLVLCTLLVFGGGCLRLLRPLDRRCGRWRRVDSHFGRSRFLLCPACCLASAGRVRCHLGRRGRLRQGETAEGVHEKPLGSSRGAHNSRHQTPPSHAPKPPQTFALNLPSHHARYPLPPPLPPSSHPTHPPSHPYIAQTDRQTCRVVYETVIMSVW